jgi:UPF0755 protein
VIRGRLKSILASRQLRLLCLLLVLLITAVGCFAWRWLHMPFMVAPANSANEIIFEVRSGDSLARTAYRLKRETGLQYPRLLINYARLAGLNNIKFGEFLLRPEQSPVSVLKTLVNGQVLHRSITFVEGTRVSDVLSLLKSERNLAAGATELNVENLVSVFGIEQSNPEGWLFPDTYQFTRQTSAWTLLEQSHKRMRHVLEQEWQQRSPNLPYASPYEALIMASIIEKETGVASEREQIAGVFVRRLQKGMRLQTDPTVIYGMGDSYRGDIKRKHLRQKTPYNTYVIKGLPPTPIALPGREAIVAALHPAPGRALYFVARGDGSHQFSETLAEHQAAVRRYQLRRAEDYRSAPNG